MLNRIDLMGRIVKEVDLRYTSNNTPIASFTIACDRDYQAGGSEKQTDFIECVAWKHTAEFVSKYFQKGQMIAITGRLQSRKWKDRDENNRISWEVIAESVYFCGEKKTNAVNVSASDFVDLPDDDGEIPF